MRRQARIFAGGALVVRTASALQVWLWLLLFVFQNEFRISRSIQPGYLDFDNLPDTNFTCTGKVIGGYYADLETSCQMFHVCTVGQQDEPMDIKFLCLNGTVFDQETRVCERVDEVDCTKSEKFYSLNLELYGSTAPPIIKPEENNTHASSTDKNLDFKKEDDYEDVELEIDDDHSISHKNEADIPDTTEDPIQETKKDLHKPTYFFSSQPTHASSTGASEHKEPIEENQEEPEVDSELSEYDDEFITKTQSTTQATSSSTIKAQRTTTLATTLQPSPKPHFVSSVQQPQSSLSPPSQSTQISSPAPSSDPSLLSPQEFIYRHRGPGSETISFQRQSFRPADGVYITHAPQMQTQQEHSQFDHFQYESSRTAPRPSNNAQRPIIQKPAPTPFRATTLDPRDQLLRPGPSSQSSERHETTVKHRQQTYLPSLPPSRPLPFEHYYFDRKRSDDIPISDDVPLLLAPRSVPPKINTERPPAKLKSPPRVIVTASASVSDSNGKRLNYTVGNVVSAVKPIVAINYDDYKESDLIFDPFFLDVPKLQKRRKTRGNKNNITILNSSVTTTGIPFETEISSSNISSESTTNEQLSTSTSFTTTTTTAAWSPDDYVNDNYEPIAYMAPPLFGAFLSKKDNKLDKIPKNSKKTIKSEKRIDTFKRIEDSKPMPSPATVQTTSSQYEAPALRHGKDLKPPGERDCTTTECLNRA